jgi:hypothetical protein
MPDRDDRRSGFPAVRAGDAIGLIAHAESPPRRTAGRAGSTSENPLIWHAPPDSIGRNIHPLKQWSIEELPKSALCSRQRAVGLQLTRRRQVSMCRLQCLRMTK